MTAARRPLPPSAWILGVLLPAAIGLAGAGLQAAWLPELPDPLAIHWGGDDRPDGFESPIVSILVSAALAIALPAAMSFMLLGAGRRGLSATHKLIVCTSLAVCTAISIVATGSTGMQRGLADAAQAGGAVQWILIGFGIGIVLGILAWFLMPRPDDALIEAVEAVPLELAPGERGVWITSVQVATGAVVGISAAVLFAFAGAVVVAVATGGIGAFALALPIVLLVAAATSLAWRVRVDQHGLRVAARPFGWPAVRIRPEEIARVETVDVDAVAEFGGFGWRWAPGRSFGVIARSGEAIEVERRDGRRFTVTVDRAQVGASLLAAYAAQHDGPQA